MQPHALITIKFLTPEEGGRQKGIKGGGYYSCPIRIDGEYFDCRLLIGNKIIELGIECEIPVVFLCIDDVKSKLILGKFISVWEGKDIAYGRISKILI